MNCWHCQTELIWGCDHDISDEDETYSMVTNLSCPECECIVDIYLPKEKESDAVWSCMNCGYTHLVEQEPISCIICNSSEFSKDPSEFYKLLDLKECKGDTEET